MRKQEAAEYCLIMRETHFNSGISQINRLQLFDMPTSSVNGAS